MVWRLAPGLPFVREEKEVGTRRKPVSKRRLKSPNTPAVIGAFMRMLKRKDPYTFDHVQRVQRYVEQLTKALGWDAYLQECASIAALLHDIGKIVVERATLSNALPANVIQRAELHDHPYEGATTLSGLFPAEVINGILEHHERWDGKVYGPYPGYPFGRKGEEISPIAQCIAICDCYDAATTQRPYNQVMPKSMALAMIEREAGSKFDPDLVRVFVHRVAPKL